MHLKLREWPFGESLVVVVGFVVGQNTRHVGRQRSVLRFLNSVVRQKEMYSGGRGRQLGHRRFG